MGKGPQECSLRVGIKSETNMETVFPINQHTPLKQEDELVGQTPMGGGRKED